MKYTGPPRPIPTEYHNPVGKRLGKALFLLFLLFLIGVLLMDLICWRPG